MDKKTDLIQRTYDRMTENFMTNLENLYNCAYEHGAADERKNFNKSGLLNEGYYWVRFKHGNYLPGDSVWEIAFYEDNDGDQWWTANGDSKRYDPSDVLEIGSCIQKGE